MVRRGEERRAPAPRTTVSFVGATISAYTSLLGFFPGTFCSDSHWNVSVWIQLGSPAEHSTDEATRKKKSCSLFCVAESETAVTTCWLEPSLGMFSNILKMPPMHWKTVVTPTTSEPVTLSKVVWKPAVPTWRELEFFLKWPDPAWEATDPRSASRRVKLGLGNSIRLKRAQTETEKYSQERGRRSDDLCDYQYCCVMRRPEHWTAVSAPGDTRVRSDWRLHCAIYSALTIGFTEIIWTTLRGRTGSLL